MKKFLFVAPIFVAILFFGCTNNAQFGDAIVLPSDSHGTNYFSNGNGVSDEAWHDFVQKNFALYNNKVFITDYGEILCFKIENSELNFVYAFGLSSSEVKDKNISEIISENTGAKTPTAGKIIGIDCTKSDGKGGVVLLLEAAAHYNFAPSACYTANEDAQYGTGEHHACYIPMHITFYGAKNSLTYSNYYDNGICCFKNRDDAIKNAPYKSDFYGRDSVFVATN